MAGGHEYEGTPRIPVRLRRVLEHRHLPWLLALLAMLLCAPSLRLGLQWDDAFHRAALTMPDLPMVSRSPADLFVFIEGDTTLNRLAISLGMLPWWADEHLRIAFFRPVTGLTHWLDYTVWPQWPWMMHLQSLAWFGAAVAVAALFYRRMFSVGWMAGLAALLFAVDDAHSLPAIWLANRNALISGLFGLLTLIAHDRWRRDGSWVGAVAAPLMLLLGVLSNESTAAVGAYLLAYALCFDRGRAIGRLGSLAPCALAGVVWWMVYKHQGYGVAGSGWYLEPGADPGEFLRAVGARAPLLLAWQWLVPTDLQWSLSPAEAHRLALIVLGLGMIIAVLLVPLLRCDRLARFWALGMILSVVPACACFPSDRLLFFVGIGAMGLLAQFIATVVRKVDGLSGRSWWRLPARVMCLLLVLVHLLMAPWGLLRMTGSFERNGRLIGQSAGSLPSGVAAQLQRVVIVGAPTFAEFAYGALERLTGDDPFESRSLMLCSGNQPVEIHRSDTRTLLVRPDSGFLTPAEGYLPGSAFEQLLFDQRRALFGLDWIYYDRTSMQAGQRIALGDVTVEVMATTDDGRPAEVAFRFAVPLEAPLYTWMAWQNGKFAPFALPAVGETVVLPAATIPL